MRISLFLLCIISCPLSAQIYKVLQEDGTFLYTDTPQEGAEKVEMQDQTQNTTSSLPTPAPPKAVKQTRQKAPDYQVSILTPPPQATIRDNRGNITISGKVSPSFRGRYQLIFDGEATLQNTSGTFALKEVNRGEHHYQINILDNKGKTLASSPQQTLYLHQASVLINNN